MLINSLLLLVALGLIQARPNEDLSPFLWEAHQDCPPAETHYLLPHEYDCTKFYYCEYGLKYIEARDCAEGTEFSYEEQVCVHPRDSGCTLPGPGPTDAPPARPTAAPTAAPPQPPTEAPEIDYLENGCPSDFELNYLLPHDTYCNKFYHCVDGEKVARLCPRGLWFNAELQVCDWPEDVECSGEIYEPEPEEEDDAPPAPTAGPPAPTAGPPAPTAGPSAPTVGPPAPTVAPPQPPTEAPEIDFLENGCPADFDFNFHLPHDTYCNKYYHCVDGEKVARLCPSGLWFNAQLQVCDWPKYVECSGEIYEPETEEDEAPTAGPPAGPPAPTAGPPAPTAAPPQPPTEAPEIDFLENGCPADFDFNFHLPHDTYCNKYYHCVDGEKVARLCPSGLWFNAQLQVCDWPEDVECSGEIYESETEDDDSPPAPTAGPPAGPPAPTAAPPQPPTEAPEIDFLENGCPADFDFNFHLPHDTYCNKYYHCVNGEKVARLCPSGLWFNAQLQLCDWPQDVECSGEIYEPEPEEEDDAPPAPTAGPPAPTVAPPQPPTEAPEIDFLENGCPADFDFNFHLPHETYCNKYYHCVNGETVARLCPKGLFFNPELQVCDWPQNVDCSGDIFETEDSDSEDSGTDSEDPDTDSEDSDSDNEDNDIGDILDNGCPADIDIEHLLPHELECDKYYHCVFGEKVERNCAPGTYFNYELQICDWPENVDCVSGGGNGDGGSEGDNDDGSENGDNGSEGGDNGSEDGDNDSEGGDNGSEGGDNGSGGGGNGGEGGDNDSEGSDNGSEGGDNGSGGGDNGSEGGDNDSEGGDNGSEGGDDSDDGSDNNDWEALPNGCPQDSSIEWLLPSENDCAKFYHCDNGLKIQKSCAYGTHFNFAEQKCDWPENAGCEIIDGGDGGDIGDQPDDVDVGDNEGSDGGNDNDNQPDDEDDDDVPIGDDEGSDNGNDNGGNDESDGGNDESDGGNDESDGGNDESDDGNDESDDGNDESDGGNDDGNDESDGAFETLPNGCPADFDIHWLLPQENNCSQFVQCVNGEFSAKDCPPGLHFNAKLQVCDWPRYAGCDPNYEVDDNDNESDNGNDNDSDGSDNGNDNDSDGSDNGNDNDSDGGDNGNDNDNDGGDNGDSYANKCKNECNVLPWAAENSNKYWICNGETPVLITCAEGLYYNAEALTCDFPLASRNVKNRRFA